MLGYHVSIDDVKNLKYIEGLESAQIFLTNRMLHAPPNAFEILKKLLLKKELTDEEKKNSFYINITATIKFIKYFKIKILIIHASYTTQLFSTKDDVFMKSLQDVYFYTSCCKVIERETKAKAYYNIHLPKKTSKIRNDELSKLFTKTKKYLLLETETDSPIPEFVESCELNLCFDTAHVSASGKDIMSTFKSLRKIIECIHLNGNMLDVGSKRDKHCAFNDKENKVPKLEEFIKYVSHFDLPIILERGVEIPSNEIKKIQQILTTTLS